MRLDHLGAVVSKRRNIQILEDALAFANATGAAGLTETQARQFAAALGSLSRAQRERICAAALEQRRTLEARTARRSAR